MNILFVSAVLPYPLYSGGQVRIYNLLRLLGKEHKITLLSFIRSPEERTYVEELSFCHRVETVVRGNAWQAKYILPTLFGSYPLLFSTYQNRAMREKIVTLLATGDYDLLHLEPGYVWPSVPSVSLPIVVTQHNIEYPIYEEYVRRFPVPPLRPFLWLDTVKLRFWEEYTWKHATRIVAVSDQDRDVIARSAPGVPVSVIPNGVDLLSFPFRPRQIDGIRPTFLFVGNFSWVQNRDAVTHLLRAIWPKLLEQYPGAKLNIVGRNAPRELARLISEKGAHLLDRVTRIRDEFEASDILIAPIRVGGGTKFKILEAMASGLPVVTTHIGGSGLDLIAGQEIIEADSTEEIIVAVSRLIGDPKGTKGLVTAARKKIETTYAWTNIAKSLDAVWKGAV